MRWMLIALIASACGGDGGNDSKIRIGLLTPKSGSLQVVGESFERVAITAVNRINEQGGVDGHELVLVVKDTASDPQTAKREMEEMVSIEGVAAVIGPARSSSVSVTWDLALAFETPMISPSSTAASLINVADGGYMFRNVPNDSLQGVVQGHYLTDDGIGGPQLTTTAVMYEVGEYGQGLATSFEQ